MKRVLFTLLLSMAAACEPDFSGLDPATTPDAAPVVETSRHPLNGVGIRMHLRTTWDPDWDTYIKVFSPNDGEGGGFFPADAYAQPTFNMYVAENPVTQVPAMHSSFRGPSSVTNTFPSCGHSGGIREQMYNYPWLDNLVPGHTYFFWFMPRCSSGSWPVGGPSEGQWRFSITVPTAVGDYEFYANISGFFNNKLFWKSWFQGCGNTMDSHWLQTSLMQRFVCFKPNTLNCHCLNGRDFPGEPRQTLDVNW